MWVSVGTLNAPHPPTPSPGGEGEFPLLQERVSLRWFIKHVIKQAIKLQNIVT